MYQKIEGSLHLIADVEYLGRVTKVVKNEQGQYFSRTFFNIGVLFWRTRKETGEPCPRFRIVGIGSNDEDMYREFNLIYKAIFGHTLDRGELYDDTAYPEIAKRMKAEVSKMEINAYVKFEKCSTHWYVDEM